MIPGQKRSVIVLSSHVARGSVGNRAAVFALEVRGHPVWAVPTIILPFHPGHGRATRIVPEEKLFASMLDDLAESRWSGEVGAVLTGYMPSAVHARLAGRFIEKLKKQHPALLYCCDPVMGDNGRLYVDEGTAIAMRDALTPQADIITPNIFELQWLTGHPAQSPDEAIKAGRKLESEIMLVTSMPGMMRGNIANLLITGHNALMCEHRMIANPPNGPGDLTAALFLSHLLSGTPAGIALELVSASVFEIVSGAAMRGADELMLETDAGSIRNPVSRMTTRIVG